MDGVKCFCGQAAYRGEVKKDGPNKGKYFLRCAKWPHPGHCKFFEWSFAIALNNATPAPIVTPVQPPVLVTPSQMPDKETNLRIVKLEWRVAVLEDVIREIGKSCNLRTEGSK